MAVTRADVIKIAPELSAVPDGGVFDFFISMASQINDDQYMGSYLTAHLLTVSQQAEANSGTSSANQGSGPVSSQTVGEVSTTYAAGGSGMFVGASAGTILMGLQLTKYGIIYAQLMKMQGPVALVVG